MNTSPLIDTRVVRLNAEEFNDAYRVKHYRRFLTAAGLALVLLGATINEVSAEPNVPKYRQEVQLPNGKSVQIYQTHGSDWQKANWGQYYVDPDEYRQATDDDNDD